MFYQLLAGATPAERREFRLEAPEKYRYLNMGGVTTVPGLDDSQEFATGATCSMRPCSPHNPSDFTGHSCLPSRCGRAWLIASRCSGDPQRMPDVVIVRPCPRSVVLAVVAIDDSCRVVNSTCFDVMLCVQRTCSAGGAVFHWHLEGPAALHVARLGGHHAPGKRRVH